MSLRSSLGWFGQVVAWFVILAITAILVVAVAIPRVVGGTPYVILTGSMRPSMPPGTLVVVKPTPIEKIGIGDVITYQLRSGDPTVVTHRVVSVGINGEGERILRTQGDANNVADANPVMAVQVKGERFYSIPYLGYVTNLLTGRQRHVATIVVAVILLGYAAWMFIGAARDRRRSGHDKEEVHQTSGAA